MPNAANAGLTKLFIRKDASRAFPAVHRNAVEIEK
jgi:hypothetical protein